MSCGFLNFFFKSFPDIVHRPVLVDMTIEGSNRLKIIYASSLGFHAVDMDSGSMLDIYVPHHVRDKRREKINYKIKYVCSCTRFFF